MSLDASIREAERAVGALRRSRDDSAGWSDQQRNRFDRQRLQPLLEAGSQLVLALRRAKDQLDAVRRTLERSG